MKTTKTVFHIFDASAFDEELGVLNEMSEKGWQLSDMDMRWFSQKYVWDDSVVYRYAIDYRDHLWRHSTLLIILLMLLGVACSAIGDALETEFNPVMRSDGPLPPLSGVQSAEVTVKLPDLYGIHAYAEEADIQSVPYWVTDEDGELIYSGVVETKAHTPNEPHGVYHRPEHAVQRAELPRHL